MKYHNKEISEFSNQELKEAHDELDANKDYYNERVKTKAKKFNLTPSLTFLAIYDEVKKEIGNRGI